MNGKKVLNFLLVRSAFTQRNFTTLFLVGIFVGVFVVSGGKITLSVPRLPKSESFGSIAGAREAQQLDDASKEKSLEVLGVKPSKDQAEREQTINKRGRLFDPDVDGAKEEKLDKDGLLGAEIVNRREETRLRRAEGRQADPLSSIEERLNIRHK